MYSDKVLDHFMNPRHVGVIEDADGVGILGDPECGDYIKVYLKIADERITDIRFQISGCPAAVACGSAMAEMACGLTVDEAEEITDLDILAYLGGLPEGKDHCSNLGAGALHNAIFDYIIKSLKKDGHISISTG